MMRFHPSRLSLFFLILFNATVHFFLLEEVPLEHFDEVFFLRKAQQPGLNVSWSALYTLWIKFLHFFSSDPLTVYYLNHVFMTSGVSLISYFVLKKLGVSPWARLFAAMMILCGSITYYTLARVNHFNLILSLVVLLSACSISKDKKFRYLFISLGMALCCYIRQDNIGIFFVFLALGLFESAGQKKFKLKNVFWGPWTWTFLGLILLFFYFNPFLGDRFFSPLQQHFSIFIQVEGVDPGLTESKIFEKFFGQASTVGEMFKTNAEALMIYFSRNMIGWQVVLKWHMLEHFPLILKRSAYGASGGLDILSWVLIFCLSLFIGHRFTAQRLPMLRTKIRNDEPTLDSNFLFILRVFFILTFLRTLLTVIVYSPFFYRYSVEFIVLFQISLAFVFLKPLSFVNDKKSVLLVALMFFSVFFYRGTQAPPQGYNLHAFFDESDLQLKKTLKA